MDSPPSLFPHLQRQGRGRQADADVAGLNADLSMDRAGAPQRPGRELDADAGDAFVDVQTLLGERGREPDRFGVDDA